MLRNILGCCGLFHNRSPRSIDPERAPLLASGAAAPTSAAGSALGRGQRKPLSLEDEALLAQMSKARNTFKDRFEEYELGKGTIEGPFMQTLVEAYDRNHDGMNVRYAKDFGSMFAMVDQDRARLEKGPMHFIATNSGGAHHSAWRFQSRDGEVVAIGIESLDQRSTNMGVTAMDFCDHFEGKPGVVNAAILVGTGAQKNEGNCAAFSQGFLNTFSKHPGHFDRLAQDVFRMGRGETVERLPEGDIGSDNGAFRVYGDQKTAFKLLPAHAFKNAESRKELQEYRRLEPEASAMPVSKKGEDIEGRLKRLTSLDDPLSEAKRVDMARGADKKRIHMLDAGIRHFEE